MIVFLHIPKTGGTTVCRNVLKIQNKKIYSDHYPYGVHHLINSMTKRRCKKIKYLTFLRDPIERTISNFNYCCSCYKYGGDYKSKVGDTYFKTNRDVIKTLEFCIKNQWLYNIMTRQLSGIENISNMIVSHKDFYRWRIYNPFRSNPTKKYSIKMMDNFYDSAKTNIRTFKYIGFTGDMKDSIKHMCEKMDWKVPKKIINKRVTSCDCDLIPIKQPDKKQLELLKELNKYDIKLYEEARSVKW